MIPSYPSTRHWPESLSVHRDDHYHRDPSFFIGKPVVITEKLDGGITQFAGGKVYARASSAATSDPWFDYVKSRTLPKLYAVPANLQPIGEDLYGVHSIEYDPIPDTFFLFHVLDRVPENIGTENTQGDHFWSWSGVKEFAGVYGIRHVPVLFEGTFDKLEQITAWFMDNVKKPSRYGPQCEGFVMRDTEAFPFENFGIHTCKFVRANHVQTDERWEKYWKKAKLQR